MSHTRTTVTIDDDLLKRAKMITKVEGIDAVITTALEQLVRHDALHRLADLLGTDPDFGEETPRRRPPDFVNSSGTGA
jgi:hypothetical protein